MKWGHEGHSAKRNEGVRFWFQRKAAAGLSQQLLRTDDHGQRILNTRMLNMAVLRKSVVVQLELHNHVQRQKPLLEACSRSYPTSRGRASRREIGTHG